MCSVRRCLVWRSSWQPVRTSPACPPDTVLPRPCCRAAWNFVSDYREQKRLTFRRRDADRCAGLPCRYGWGNATVHRGMRDAAEIPPDRTFRSPPPSRRQASRLGHPLRMILFCFRCPRVTSGRVSVGRAFRGSASVERQHLNVMSSLSSLFIIYPPKLHSVSAAQHAGYADAIGGFATSTLLLTPPVVNHLHRPPRTYVVS